MQIAGVPIFCMPDGWESDWEHLPIEFKGILEDLGGTIHDTFSSPEIAANFNGLPEQFLERVQKLPQKN